MRTLVLLLALAPLLGSCRATTGAGGGQPAAPPEPEGVPPAAAFFRAPVLSHLCLSPDGSWIAGITARDGVQRLVVVRPLGGAMLFLAQLDEPGQRIARLGWASDERILVSVEMRSRAVVGMRARQTRLLSVPLDGSPTRYLGRNWPHQERSQFQDQIIDWLPDDPEHVLISWWEPGERAGRVSAASTPGRAS